MGYNKKQIGRGQLRSFLNKRCECYGKIICRSKVWGNFGINDGNKTRILLHEVKIECVKLQHIWTNLEIISKYHYSFLIRMKFIKKIINKIPIHCSILLFNFNLN